MSNSDRYVTVRIERHAHEDTARFAERWGLTKSDALTMLVRRGLAAAAEREAPPTHTLEEDQRRIEREAASVRSKSLPLRPAPLPGSAVGGPGTQAVADLTAAVGMLTEVVQNLHARSVPAPYESTTMRRVEQG